MPHQMKYLSKGQDISSVKIYKTQNEIFIQYLKTYIKMIQ